MGTPILPVTIITYTVRGKWGTYTYSPRYNNNIHSKGEMGTPILPVTIITYTVRGKWGHLFSLLQLTYTVRGKWGHLFSPLQ